MSPVIRRLQNQFDLPSPVVLETKQWVFDSALKNLAPSTYHQLFPLQPVLTMEYSILCHQLRQNFAFPEGLDEQQVLERLASALMLCELLEHSSLYYLNVPREVHRLRQHKKIFRELLSELGGYTFANEPLPLVKEDTQFSSQVREKTSLVNGYRLMLARSRRFLNTVHAVGLGSDSFGRFVVFMDYYTAPLFAHLSWLVFLPRMGANLFLLLKHTIPGSWMSEEEQSLGWSRRLHMQIQRRWFDLSNDVTMVVIGILNGFVLLGPLAPIGVFISLGGFAFDVVCAGIRAYIELNRLCEVQKQYNGMLEKAQGSAEQANIAEYQKYLGQRIHFEQWRLMLSVINTSLVLAFNALLLPMLVLNPLMPVIVTALLVVLWGVNFTMIRLIESHRPQDAVEKPANLSKLGFFAHRVSLDEAAEPELEHTPSLSEA